ncbi:serine/threonine-protein phosphatase [Sphaerisporangium sp. TRM90804]|uniref:PP2C family protein-serine/threonine phosphatase n=1 Tax=Sphaerisporangium sp. TRM90804 TaxID=3031113 RepID=UPI002446ADCC|nr:serine/threonine-protein phosphatase [Sphaerisporangium sp. TRM90804]MDH2425661.1 serine/threonine-protein phosphatase [Sphaerisporangium sp. TRM90804]
MDDRLVVTLMTHTGAVRDANEDAVTAAGLVVSRISMPEPVTLTVSAARPVLVAVADGLGGHAGGEVAAGHAVTVLASEGASVDDLEGLARLVKEIDVQVTAMSDRSPRYAGMGTTVAGLLFGPEKTSWFNVGDSRVYRMEDRFLGRLSVDDSPGGGEPGAAAPVTHIVTQVVGGTGGGLEVHGGDDSRDGCWLVCSDGLSDLVSVAEMEETLNAEADDALAVKRMWALAMNASGRDNITIVLARRGSGEGAVVVGV